MLQITGDNKWKVVYKMFLKEPNLFNVWMLLSKNISNHLNIYMKNTIFHIKSVELE